MANRNPSSEKAQKRLGRPTDTAKRTAIVEAAAQSFFDVGFAATSIEQVAANAGVSKVTIYNHFGDKSALFSAAVTHECDKMRGLFSIEDAASGTIRERLHTIGEAMFAFLSRPEMIRFEHRVAAETEHDPAIGRSFLEAGPWSVKRDFGTFLAFATQTGELAVDDPELAAEQFVSMCKGMGDLEHRFGATPTAQATAKRIAGAVDVFLKAYGADKTAH